MRSELKVIQIRSRLRNEKNGELARAGIKWCELALGKVLARAEKAELNKKEKKMAEGRIERCECDVSHLE